MAQVQSSIFRAFERLSAHGIRTTADLDSYAWTHRRPDGSIPSRYGGMDTQRHGHPAMHPSPERGQVAMAKHTHRSKRDRRARLQALAAHGHQLAGRPCPRCGGQILRTWDAPQCLQCGREEGR